MIAAVGLASIAAYLLVTTIKYVSSRRYLTQTPDEVADCDEGDVTVLQPILSGDPLLESTLRKSGAAASSSARYWLLVDTDDDEGRRIAEALEHDHPERFLMILCEPPQEGQNPKAAKLDHALPLVQSRFVAVLDDDTWLPADNLSKAVARLAVCDLYTGLPCYVPAHGFWSGLVTQFVNNSSPMTYLPLLSITGPLTINGMFYVTRTEAMREIGGWGARGDQLCDDLAIARAFLDRGKRIHQGVTPQFLRTTVDSRSGYLSLMHRWYLFADVLVTHQTPRIQAMILLLLGFPPFLLVLAWLSIGAGPMGILALTTCFVVRHAMIRDLWNRLLDKPPAISWWQSLLVEMLQPIHWIHAKLSKTIIWRGHRILAHANGKFEYLDQSR